MGFPSGCWRDEEDESSWIMIMHLKCIPGEGFSRDNDLLHLLSSTTGTEYSFLFPLLQFHLISMGSKSILLWNRWTDADDRGCKVFTMRLLGMILFLITHSWSTSPDNPLTYTQHTDSAQSQPKTIGSWEWKETQSDSISLLFHH